MSDLLQRSRLMADQLEQSAAIIRELCDVLERAGEKMPVPYVLSETIENLGFLTRIYGCLVSEDIRTVGDLISKTPNELLQIRNFAITSLHEVRQILAPPVPWFLGCSQNHRHVHTIKLVNYATA